MKITFALASLLLTAAAVFGQAVTATTPGGYAEEYVQPVYTTAEGYNDTYPMPEAFPVLTSREEFKADVLRRIEYGRLEITGPAISKNGTTPTIAIAADTPQQILDQLAAIDHKLSMPDKTLSVHVFIELHDAYGYGRLHGYADVVPTLQPDGTYLIKKKVDVELEEWQQLPDLKGDIAAANITNIDQYGYSTTRALSVWDGRVMVPMSMIGVKGFLTIVRQEPAGNGQTRAVSYGYDLQTGKSQVMTDVKNKMAYGVNNYFEFNDKGRPLFIGGSSVPLYADMRLSKVAYSPGRFNIQSQPVARVDVTVAGRILAVWTGLYDQDGILWQRGDNVRVRNSATGVITSIPIQGDGLGTIVLPIGSYDLMYHLDAFDQPTYGRG